MGDVLQRSWWPQPGDYVQAGHNGYIAKVVQVRGFAALVERHDGTQHDVATGVLRPATRVEYCKSVYRVYQKVFEHNPSATNYAKLEQAMLAYQEASNAT